MRIELVKHAIEPIVIDTVKVEIQNIDQRRAPHPIRHGVFGGRRNQSVKHHRASQLADRLRQAAVVQNAVKIETLPELVADVDRPGFTVLLGCDPRWIDGNQLPMTGGSRRLLRGVLAVLSHMTNDLGDFGIGLIDQALLTKQSILDLAREAEPLFARPWAEIAKRTNALLAWPLWGLHKLDQDVVGIRPAFVGAR